MEDNLVPDNQISIGEMAELNNVSTQTLRYYDSIDLLKPIHIDKFTGYRHYDMRQSAKLFIIQQMKYLGISLTEIKELFNNNNEEKIFELLKEQSNNLENNIQDLIKVKKTTDRHISSYIKYMEAQFNQVTVEHIPQRKILVYNTSRNVYERDSETGRFKLNIFEDERRKLEQLAKRKKIGSIFSYNVTDMIKKEDFLNRNFVSYRISLILENDVPMDKDIMMLPENYYACMYFNEVEKAEFHAEKLLDYIESKNIEVIGDYISEAVQELPTKDFDKYMYLRIQVPVKLFNK